MDKTAQLLLALLDKMLLADNENREIYTKIAESMVHDLFKYNWNIDQRLAQLMQYHKEILAREKESPDIIILKAFEGATK